MTSRMPTLSAHLLLSLALLGCGSPGSPPTIDGDPLCDGSGDLRFAVRIVGGFVDPATMIETRNGHRFLYVDGTCQYWVYAPQASNFGAREVHTGQLTSAQADALATDVAWGKLGARTDAFVPAVGLADGATDELWDPTGKVSCYGCSATPQPRFAADVLDAVETWTAELWTEGTAMTGAVRIGLNSADSDRLGVAWPLSQPVSDFAIDFTTGTSPIGGFRVEGADAEALRALRATDLAQLEASYALIVEAPDGSKHTLYMADALPLEDATGQVALP